MATVKHIIYAYGLQASDAALRIAEPLMSENPTVDIAENFGELSITVCATSYSVEEADVICRPVIDTICDCLGPFVCGIDFTLEQKVVELLKEHSLKITTAESCTAGLLAGKLTNISGVSSVFDGGFITYSHEMKHLLLGVSDTLLKEKGAVCPEVAISMAVGCRRMSEADIGVSVTGVAGPEPSDGQPVGTVYIALADTKRVWVKKLEESGTREDIRSAAVIAALDLVRRYLEAKPGMMAGSQPIEKPSSEKIIIPSEVKPVTFWEKILPWKAKGKAAIFFVTAIWVLVLGILAVTGILSYNELYIPHHNEQIYEDLEAVYTGPLESTDEIDINKYPKGMLSQFYTLFDRNEDIAGWIKIDKTHISYPLMIGNSAPYYDNHDFAKNPSEFGVPYFDSRVDFSSSETNNMVYTVYGKTSSDSQMFSDIVNYTQENFFIDHQWISMDTIYKTATWQAVAVMYVDSSDNNAEFDYGKNTFSSLKEYSDFLKEIQKRSLFNMAVELSTNDTLLMLSVDYTGSNAFENEKVVVVARRATSTGSNSIEDLTKNYSAVMPRAYYMYNTTKTYMPERTTKKVVPKTTEATKSPSKATKSSNVISVETASPVIPTTIHTNSTSVIPTHAPTTKPTNPPTTTRETTIIHEQENSLSSY